MSKAARFGLAIALFGWLLVGVAAWRIRPVLVQLFDPHRPKTYYIPSKSMLPTLHVNDRIRPRVASATDLRSGVVILCYGPGSVRVTRIVAVAGDEVSVRRGLVWVKGRAATVREGGMGPSVAGGPSRVQIERLPGERGAHRILDIGRTPQDDYGPVRVPAGTLFALGDNRDAAADSRFPPEEYGLGMVKTEAVIGVADRLLWAARFRELGRPIDAGASR